MTTVNLDSLIDQHVEGLRIGTTSPVVEVYEITPMVRQRAAQP